MGAGIEDGQSLPECLRTVFIDQSSLDRGIDKVFIPIKPFGNPTMLFLAACFDGVPMIRDSGHVYAPASWIMQQYPDVADAVGVIVERVMGV